VTRVKHGVVQWGVRKGDKTGCKVTLRGGAAYEFLDKLITLVLPKIKDWPGINATTGDSAGNLAFGLRPAWMAYFTEIEFNYDVSLRETLILTDGLICGLDVPCTTDARL
jgi:large subunit ribosomal protein L5